MAGICRILKKKQVFCNAAAASQEADEQTCMIPNRSRSDEDIKKCLDVLDTVVCYSYLPSECLQYFIGALCRMVNMRKYCEASWQLMRKLLGTHLGHSSIFTMCCMLQDKHQPADYKFLRGAVFYIGMALWGSKKVTSLKHTPTAVLPSFQQVCSCGNPIVLYEVVLSIQRLVRNYGKDLTLTSWDNVLDIIEAIIKQLEIGSSSGPPVDPRMHADLHDVLTEIETLYEHGQFGGSVSRFFRIIEICVTKHPENSVTLLISHHAQSIHPGKESWISALYQLLDKYFRLEKRVQIWTKAQNVLYFVLSNKYMYEDDLINRVVLLHLYHTENDPEPKVRKVATDILLCLAQGCSTHCFMDLIHLTEKIVNRPLNYRLVSPYPAPEKLDIINNVDESHLIDATPAILVDLQKILECLLQFHSDSLHRLGFVDHAQNGQLAFSAYIICKQSEFQESNPPSSPAFPVHQSPHLFSTSVLDYTKSFSLFIQALENMTSPFSGLFSLGQLFPPAGAIPAQPDCGDPPVPQGYTLSSFTGRYRGSTADYVCFTDVIQFITIKCTNRGWESLPPCPVSCGNTPYIPGLQLLDFTSGTVEGDIRYYIWADRDQTFSPASPASSACSGVTCQNNRLWTSFSFTCNTPPVTTNTEGSLSGTSGTITSRNRPGNYSPPNMAMYRYSIITPGKSITLTFNGAFGIDNTSFLNIFCGFDLPTGSPKGVESLQVGAEVNREAVVKEKKKIKNVLAEETMEKERIKKDRQFLRLSVQWKKVQESWRQLWQEGQRQEEMTKLSQQPPDLPWCHRRKYGNYRLIKGM